MGAAVYDGSRPLKDATVQEIQLELIRRSLFGGIKGERILACLLEHRELWEAVLMDRLCPYRAGALPPTLMKLRDLPSGRWNADRLLILTSDKEVGRKLAAICEEKMPGGMVHVYADPEVVDHALGQGRCGKAIISIWWD